MQSIEAEASKFIAELMERAYGPGVWGNELEGDLGTWADWERALVEFAARVVPEITMTITNGMGAHITSDGCTIRPGDVFHCYKIRGSSTPAGA